MAIDTTIQYNGRNSYKVTGMLWQWPYHVTDMTHITHSFRAMCDVAQGSGVRAKTKFIDSTGGQISEISHSFDLGIAWELKDITVPVPVGAAMAILGFVKGSRDWWVAEPKSEQGETATPFNVNYQGQLSFMTPTGLYTGFIRANQILVTGSPSQPGEQLEQRLVTINQNVVNLSASVSGQNSRITNMEAGQITLSDRLDTTEPRTSRLTAAGLYTGTIEADQITAGTISADRIAVKSITGAKLADGTVTATQIANATITDAQIASLNAGKITAGTINAARIATGSITGAKLADGTVTNIKIATGISAAKVTTGKLQSTSGNTYFDLDNSKILQQATVAGKAVQVEMSTAKPFRLSIYGNTRYQDYIYITDSSGYSGANKLVTSKYDINEDGKVDEKDLQIVFKYILRQNISPGIAWPNGYPSFNRMDVNDDGRVDSSDLNQIWLNSDVTDRITTVGGEQCGVDSTGFWMSSNWGDTKSYKFYF